MPRYSLAALLLVATLASAQSPPSIEKVRVGLPTGQAGQEAGCSRNGAWAPVAVTLRGGKEGNPQGVYKLRVETTDLEEIAYQTTAAVPALAADTLRTVTAYIVPVGDGSTFRLSLEGADGKAVRSLQPQPRDAGRDLVVGHEDVLFFGIGGGLSGMKRTGEKLDRPPEGKEADPDQVRRQYAFADDVAALPDRWIGYDAVDVVVLGTGKRDFVLQLAQDGESARRNALLEWVRRGGQLVMSCGRNKQEVAQLLARMPLLDVKVTGSEVMATLPVVSNQWSERINLAPLQQVEVATLTAGQGVNVLVREARKPVIVQSARGLGRVVLVAFDLDAPPFSTWDGQDAFWARLRKEVAPYIPGRARGKPAAADGQPGPQRGFGDEQKYDYRADLKRLLETFEEAPTISFTWVALFLLGYILLVGPLDYFILKKLFKRLELTWVTFPLTVLVVSVAAYCTAYAMKGDDLRINKIDVVDVDLNEPGQVYGTSWFTLFSPRVATYTVGIEPAGDWAAPVPEGGPKPVMTLLEGGDRAFRAGSQDLFRRPYLYADDESGLVRVPIPVWATRSFSANWHAPVKPKTPPVGFTDDVGPLRLSRDGQALVGRLTNNLPVKLTGVTLIFRDRCYSLDALEPGESKRVESLFAADAHGQGRELFQWLTGDALSHGVPLAPTGRPLNLNFLNKRETYRGIKSMMFYRANERVNSTNAGLRRLDETWRVRGVPEYPIPDRPRFRDEAIVVARTPMLSDVAEEVTKHPASPSRLWLGELPAADRERPPLEGFLTQETYLRVFIPVQRAE